MLFFFFRRINQDRFEILLHCFSGQKVLSQMMCGNLYIFGGIGAFGGFGVLTL